MRNEEWHAHDHSFCSFVVASGPISIDNKDRTHGHFCRIFDILPLYKRTGVVDWRFKLMVVVVFHQNFEGW